MAGKYKKTTTAPEILRQFLILVGKPFYFVLTYILILFATIFYWVKKLTFISIKVKPIVKSIKFTKPKRQKKHFPKFKFPQFKILIKKSLFIPLIFLIVLTLIFYFLVLKDLPSPKDLINREQEVSTKIYDRNGELLYTIYKDKNRTPVTLSQIPESVRLATLAAEDAEFYTHPGFSIRGIIRALTKNVKDNKLEGGSTITQQLVKNALLSSEKTYIRKIREVILSIGVEFKFSKDEILEMYLNEVSYGGTVYGIQEASRLYFEKDVEDLTLSESALLAGLPQSPTKYSPFGSNPDLTFSRQREVLYLMRINKYITQEQEDVASTERITFAPNRTDIKAPHFVMYVREKLIEEYGEEVVLRGGLIVSTTLDINIQNLAEKVVKEELEKLKNLNVGNAAVLVVDPKSGEILAMVGSKNYFDTEGGGNVNVTIRQRQPGSSIKIINYAQALTNGLTLASTVDDSPITFSVPGLPPYSPKNYDGTYRGKIPVRSALAESRNIPAVKILASYGVSKMIDLGEKLGITTWTERSRFGLSLTLGGGEVKLIDLTQAYSVIANMGTKKDLKTIKEVKDFHDDILFSDKESKYEVEGLEVLDPRVAFLLIDVLKDNLARTPAFGSNSMLLVPNHPEVAVKTGTSNDLKDNLTIGFNKDYLVSVWVGNNDGSPMNRIASGITGAAPIWNKIIRSLLSNKPSLSWIPPEGLVYKECYSRKEWFLEEKQISCPKILEPAASTTSD